MTQSAYEQRIARQEANNKCCGSAQRNFGNCDRAPTVTRNGKPYCWQHDPERLKAIRDEKFQEYLAKTEAQLQEKKNLERIVASYAALLAAAKAAVQYDAERGPSSPRKLPLELLDQLRAAIAAAEPKGE